MSLTFQEIPLQSQEWKLTPVAPLKCPELGEELQDHSPAHQRSWIRIPLKSLISVSI